jgi:long-subunit acyl-CoA synthetase (AMP-forming)
LNEIGIVPGSVDGLLLDDALLHIVFTLALEELGAGTVVLHDMDIPQDWNLGAVFTDRESVKSERPIQRVHVNWLHGDGDDLPSHHIGGHSPDDICRVELTSGSTGKPKAVVFMHRPVERR